MHWALCMGVLAWHSWQFSAVSRKCYLIVHVHDRSECSWWPWVVLSALCLQLHSSLLAETKAQSWDVSNVWAVCIWTDDSGASFILQLSVSALIMLLLPHIHQPSVLDLCVWPQGWAKLKPILVLLLALCRANMYPLSLLLWALRLQPACPDPSSACKLPCWHSG